METPLDPALVFLGLILPVVVAFCKQAGFSQQINSIIALLVYIAAAVIYMAYNHIDFTLESVTTNATVLTITGLTAYKMFWDAIGKTKPSDPNAPVPVNEGTSIDQKITEATSVVKFSPVRKTILKRDEKFAH